MTQVITSGLSLLFSPYVLKQVGAEAYGLVGIFVIMFAWFALLDAGLTPALTREAARCKGGAVSRNDFSYKYRGLECLISILAIPIALVIWSGSETLANRWFRPETLSITTITQVFYIMGAILLMRWLSGTQRAILAGFERHLTLHLITLISAILRFPFIVIWFQWVEPNAISYFIWQLAVSLLELATLFLMARSTFKPPGGIAVGKALRSLSSLMSFASQHVLISIITVLIIQTDKLILSRLLPLATFGYLTLAIAAAAGVNLIVVPVNQVLLPRLARLLATGRQQEANRLHRLATRATMVPIAAIAGTLSLFSHEVMYAWTGDITASEMAAPALAGYAIGNAAMAANGFAYSLQYAHGNFKRHIIGLAALFPILIPTLYLATQKHGVKGAATVWAIIWLIYLATVTTCWTLRHFLPNEWKQWILHDVLRPVLTVIFVGILLRWHDYWPDTRIGIALVLCVKSLILLIAATLGAGLLKPNNLLRMLKRNQTI